MPLDMLDRLRLDPGTRMLGELLQEREWAVWEVRRLRSEVDRLSRKHHATRIEREMEHSEGLDPKLNAQRLLRLSEVSTMIGIKRSSIYQYVSEGRFPSPVNVAIGACGGNSRMFWRGAPTLAKSVRLRRVSKLCLAGCKGRGGIKVWFDQSELRGGDVWDQKIRRQIKDCVLFIPIIWATTRTRQAKRL